MKKLAILLAILAGLAAPAEAQFTLPYPNFVADTDILASEVNANFALLANGALKRDGSGNLTGNITADNNITIDGADISDFLSGAGNLTVPGTSLFTGVPTFQAATAVINALTYTWPASHVAGTLRNDGAGVLTWSTTGLVPTAGAAADKFLMHDGANAVWSDRARFGGTTASHYLGAGDGRAFLAVSPAAGFVSSGADAFVQLVGGTLSALTNGNAFGVRIAPTLVEAGSGTHSKIGGLQLDAPTITSGVASVTDAATFYVVGPPNASGAVQNSVLVEAGQVTSLGQYRVQAIQDTIQDSTSTTPFAVAFDGTDTYDNGSMHDPSSNNSRLTVPSGVSPNSLFLIHASVQSAPSSNTLSCVYLRKNGSTIVPGSGSCIDAGGGNTSTPFGMLQISVFLEVSAADYFEVLAVQDDTTSVVYGSTTDYRKARFGMVKVY